MSRFRKSSRSYSGGWAPYVPVAERRQKAAKQAAMMAKKGQAFSPVHISGRTIANTFWGKSWCANIESYQDYSNRLPRGRTYVRNGSVIDLKIEKGKIAAQVSGSSLYKVEIGIKPLDKNRWKELLDQCAGQISSALELLQGKISKTVMAVMTARSGGLFPKPAEISFKCSCPDSAHLCKHIAATLYGVGHRLDVEPQLLFELRQVDYLELISQAAQVSLKPTVPTKMPAFDSQDLSSLFGIDVAPAVAAKPPVPNVAARPSSPVISLAKKAAPHKPKKTPVANEEKRITHSALSNELSSLIRKTHQASATFAAGEEIGLQDLQILINGSIPMPPSMTPQRRRELIKYARPAQFGRREKTLLDRQVRDTWEFPASQIEITGKKWHDTLRGTLKKLSDQLGIDTKEPQLELHNVLLYEKGQFFDKHQDSEKSDQMIATLVVILPTKHSGGELAVYNQSNKNEFSNRWGSQNKAHVVLFYADCLHEIKKITSGYRIALTYNVTASQPQVGARQPLAAPLSPALSQYFNADKKRDKKVKSLVFLLEHQYTQKSLNWEGLKGKDRAIVQNFLASEQELNLECSLALLDIRATYAASGGDDDYGYHDYDEYDDEYDEDSEDEEEEVDQKITSAKPTSRSKKSSPYQIEDNIDEEYSFEFWVGRNGKTRKSNDFYVDSSQVFSFKDLEDCDHYQEEYEGFMGNYGNTLDRWYHRSALVLWPKSDDLFFQFRSSPQAAAKALIKEIELGTFANRTQQEAYARALRQAFQTGSKVIAPEIATFAEKVANPALAATVLNQSFGLLFEERSLKLLGRLIDCYGVPWVKAHLTHWEKVSLFSKIDSYLSKAMATSRELTCWLFDCEIQIWKSTLKSLAETNRHYESQEKKSILSKAKNLLMNCAQFEALSEQFWTTLVNLIFSHSKLFKSEDLADIFQQIKTLKTLKLNGDDIILYGTKVKKVLETELAFFAKPSDWGLDQESMCSCDDCKRFNIFLTSQVTETRVMSIPLASRKHLINLVEVMKAPVSAEVDRSSSPHKLVLTKTSGTHKYRKERAAAILKASSWF